jgi:hypothetical protein
VCVFRLDAGGRSRAEGSRLKAQGSLAKDATSI